jgi:hypothetical protein
MKPSYLATISVWAVLLLSLAGCKKDNFKGTGPADPHVHMSTLAFLKQHPDLDSIAMMIEKAGLKDTLETGNVTFFSPTNNGLQKYLKVKNAADPNMYFDTLSQQSAYELMSQFIVRTSINRDQMRKDGDLVSCMDSKPTAVSLEPTGVPPSYITTIPEYVYFIKVKGTGLDPFVVPTSFPAAERDLRFRCQTSGIITTNGILHVLPNGTAITIF